jgi:ABC-type nitrate/sulfonate/bicarbonate transport system ATPase subunit
VTHDVREGLLLSDRLVVFSPLPGRIKQVFDVRHLRPVGHTLPPALQTIEAEVVDLLLAG